MSRLVGSGQVESLLRSLNDLRATHIAFGRGPMEGEPHVEAGEVAGRAQGLIGRARAAPATANEGNTQRVTRRHRTVGKPFDRQRAQQCATRNGS